MIYFMCVCNTGALSVINGKMFRGSKFVCALMTRMNIL